MINVDKEEMFKSKEIINPDIFQVGDLLRFDSIIVKEEIEEEVIEAGEGIGEDEENIEVTEVVSKYGIVTGIAEEFISCTEPTHLVSMGMNPGVMSISYTKEQLMEFSHIAILNRE